MSQDDEKIGRKRVREGGGEEDDKGAGGEGRETIEKLCRAISKEKKCLKGIELLIVWLTTRCTEQQVQDNADYLFDQLTEALPPMEMNFTHKEYSAAFIKLTTCLDGFKSLFTESQVQRLQIFMLWIQTQNNLLTDDSFVFSKACGQVHNKVLSLSGYGADSNGAEYISLLCRAILSCMRTAFKSFGSRQWAQQPVTQIFYAAAERRLLFPAPDCLDALDTLMSAFTASERKRSSWTGPIVVRTTNSIAHPLRTTKDSVLK